MSAERIDFAAEGLLDGLDGAQRTERLALLQQLADDGVIKPAVVADAIAKYGLDAERAAPWTV